MLRRLLPLTLLFPLVFAGCDTADTGGDDIFPLDSERPAGFTYVAGTLEAGEAFISDPVTQSSQAIINSNQYGPADIASAEIVAGSVELNMDLPLLDENAITIESAVLTLSADGVEDKVVARGSDFSLVINTTNAQLRREVLDIEDDDITAFLRQEEFTATLMLDVAGAGSGSYQFTVTFDVEASVTVDAAARAGAVTR